MPVRPVRIFGDPVLREKSKAIRAFDESLQSLVADLYDTMAAYNGVGLARSEERRVGKEC